VEYNRITGEQKYGQYREKNFTPQNSPFNLTLYQNVMSVDETFDSIMKFRYNLIINDPQIDEITSYLAIKWDSYTAE
jgi:hypothetical protein